MEQEIQNTIAAWSVKRSSYIFSASNYGNAHDMMLWGGLTRVGNQGAQDEFGPFWAFKDTIRWYDYFMFCATMHWEQLIQYFWALFGKVVGKKHQCTIKANNTTLPVLHYRCSQNACTGLIFFDNSTRQQKSVSMFTAHYAYICDISSWFIQ